MTKSDRAVAQKLKQLLIGSSAIIEEYTAEVCPDCTDVCCRQKHGMYRQNDIHYLRALEDIEVPRRDELRPLDGPCELLGPRG